METIAQPTGCDVPEHSANVDEFLTLLAAAQTRFLCSIAEARELLATEDGRVKKVATLQSRLTQQFLDAQQQIIRRRVDTDRQVGQVATESEAVTLGLLETARTNAESICSGRARLPEESNGSALDELLLAPWVQPADDGRTPVEFGDPVGPVFGTDRLAPAFIEHLDRHSLHQHISELATSAVQSGSEARSLAEVIEDAFETADPDGSTAKRELGEVLDEWWRVEKQDNRVMVEDAHAQAAIRLQLARIEAADVIEEACRRSGAGQTDASIPEPPSRKSETRIIKVLDTAEHLGLDEVLSSMLDSLSGDPVDPDPVAVQPFGGFPPPRGSLSVAALSRSGPHDTLTIVGTAPQEAFDQFWSVRATEGTSASPRRYGGSRHLIFPTASAAVALAVFLAWIG